MADAKSAKAKKAGTSRKKRQAASGKQKPAAPTEWAQTVLNQLAEAQKRWFEIASQQNALLLETVTAVIESTKSAPTAALSDWARQGVEGFVEAQRRWSEIAAQQSEQIIKSIQSGAYVSTSKKGAAGQGVEALLKMRRDWLDFVAQQNTEVIGVLKERLNIDDSSPIAGLADLTQRAVNNYVEIQKRWLDLAMQLPNIGGAEREPKE